MVRKGVFTITNKRTGKVYIGSSNTNLDQRIYDYWQNLKAGHHHNPNLQSDFNKYGYSEFENEIITDNCGSEEEVRHERNRQLVLHKNNTYNKSVPVWYGGGNLESDGFEESEKINKILEDLLDVIDKYNLNSYNKRYLKSQVENGSISSEDELIKEIKVYLSQQDLEETRFSLLIEDLCKKAFRFELEENYEEAIKIYDELIRFDKTHEKEYKIEQKELQKKQAQKYYEKTIELEQEGNYNEAIKYYKEAIKLDPNNTKYQNRLIKLKPKLIEYYYHYAIELEQEGKYKGAIKELEKAIELSPNNTEYQNRLNEIQKKQSAKQVEEDYQEALLLEQEGKYKGAKKLIKKLLKLHPKNKLYKKKLEEVRRKQEEKYYQDALQLEKQGKYKEAINLINNALQLNPDNTKYKIKFNELKNKEKAQQHYKKALQLKKQGKTKEAKKLIEKASKLDPKNRLYKKL